MIEKLLTMAPVALFILLGSAGATQAQEGVPTFYVCRTEANAETASVGVTLCDAQPTAELSASSVQDNLQVREGALVTELEPDGISAVAGLQAGDMIYRVEGVDVTDADTAADHLARVQSTSDTVVNFLRRGRPYRVKIRRN